MKNPFHVLAATLLIVLSVSCRDSRHMPAAEQQQPPTAEQEVITEEASDHLEITAEFVELRDAPDAGRVANLTLANKSEYSLVGFRGWIVGMDSNGEGFMSCLGPSLLCQRSRKPTAQFLWKTSDTTFPRA